MSIFKRIQNENVTTNSSKVFKTITLDSSSLGVNTYKFNSKSSSLSSEGSHYNSLLMNFYLSGSDYALSESRFDNPWFRLQRHMSDDRPEHLHKFHTHEEGFFYNIPQEYYGQRIERGTFQIEDRSILNVPYVIKDDGYGNLYCTNPHTSASSDSHLSSSENYIGNIFYDFGIAAITTKEDVIGSSGAGSYLKLGTNYSIQFNSEKDVHTSFYKLKLEPNEFLTTNNPSAAATQNFSDTDIGYLDNNLTGSTFAPYFNTVGFYDQEDTLVMTARYPQNIKRRKDIPITLIVKMDW